MAFPPYRRSHLRSNTYHALVHLLSHFAEYNSSHETSTQPFNIPDDGIGRMDRVNQEKRPKCSEVVDSDFLSPTDPISQKDMVEVQEIIEGVGDKDTDFTSNKIVLDDIEHMMEIEDMPTPVNGFDKEHELMNEFELVMKGTEDLICDSDLIPMNTEFDVKHNDGREVGLMDFQVDMEEGEISGDLGKDGNSCDVPSADALILPQKQVDDLQEPVNVTRNMMYPSTIVNQEKEKDCEPTSSAVNSLQDGNDSGQVEPITGDNKRIACRVEVAISEKTFECKKEDKMKSMNASKRNKRGGKKDKKKKAYRMKRAEKNRELGVKSLQFQKFVQKPKAVSHCRHYIMGRCYEGDKCQFSHDVVPRTKSKPCGHFAHNSCMKGNDCPFDHELSKYPCNNILSQGFCRRGESCLFSHQVSKEDIPSNIPTPSNMRRPVLSTLQSGNANSSTPVSNNHGSGTMQQNLLTHSSGIHSRVNVEHKAANTAQKQPTPPKGISFINLAKFTPSPSAQKQGTVTIKESPLQTGMHEEQRAFNKSQNKVEIAKKLPSVTPKGVNFLSFGKGSVSGSKTHIHPNLSTENGFNLPRLLNFGLPEQIKKDVHDKPSDRTQQSVSLSDIFLNEILGKNQSVSEGVKSKFPDKTSVTPSPFDSIQSSEHLKSDYHKHASNSSQKALLSTLAFAAEHESDIKMKCPSVDSSA
ncbi:zinc finger CCCH domain-containing protein 65 isoform X1 [Vigna umbellata]|uniref:zinc finger CCCH domain-containing protein 65 isoform X1 n=1 Tax=Vigna umbellata TaxID=87088 RepID=UPI001F5ECDE5|nr:zinc finger CCCH domain-containing protein 65 isoform X1 [Vigna umbellata]XP_047157376.1 zinc finger CCCH domain-containing protein 65 isoform X1 [Vigna umbellata]